jgi:hypothetical protein
MLKVATGLQVSPQGKREHGIIAAIRAGIELKLEY